MSDNEFESTHGEQGEIVDYFEEVRNFVNRNEEKNGKKNNKKYNKKKYVKKNNDCLSPIEEITEKILENRLIDVKIKKVLGSNLNHYFSLEGRIVDAGIFQYQETVWVKLYHNNKIIRFPLNHVSIIN